MALVRGHGRCVACEKMPFSSSHPYARCDMTLRVSQIDGWGALNILDVGRSLQLLSHTSGARYLMLSDTLGTKLGKNLGK